MITPSQVGRYMWPHYDDGKALWAVSWGNPLKHGDYILYKNGSKSIFRLLEANQYEDEWMREALPIAKELWERLKNYEKDLTEE